MKEMKVIRKRRRRVSRAAQKRRRIILLSVMVLCAVCVVGVTGILCIGYLSGNKDADMTEPTQAPCVIENGQVSAFEIEVGDTGILTVSADDAVRDSLSFSCDNTDVLIVDSGGRIDAKKEGSATVSVVGNGYSGGCNVTVKKASKSITLSGYTTAITANSDIVSKNIPDKSKILYSIKVNRSTNTVTVYTYDDKGDFVVPVRAMVCSCGKFDKDNITPVGDYSVYFKDRWHALFGDVYGQYVTGFSGHYLFHSVPYKNTVVNTLETAEFNKLGTNASQGCVRLMAADAKWIYDNCDMDTPVSVVDEPKENDPLGTPPTIKIASTSNWDPTDPDTRNPYRKKSPEISGAESLVIKVGSKYDPKKGIKATDTCGNDITDKLTVIENVITTKPGKYYVTYKVEDDMHVSARKTISVTVE